jgi:hypothetical protein
VLKLIDSLSQENDLMKFLASLCLLLSSIAFAQTPTTSPIPAPTLKTSQHIEKGSRVFIEPMDGFETYLSAAILKKKVPLVVTDDKDKADYIITGTSHIERASWAKTIFISGAPQAGASIAMKNAKTGDLVYAYSVDKYNAARAQQSTAEACAKHLKESIEK